MLMAYTKFFNTDADGCWRPRANLESPAPSKPHPHERSSILVPPGRVSTFFSIVSARIRW